MHSTTRRVAWIVKVAVVVVSRCLLAIVGVVLIVGVIIFLSNCSRIVLVCVVGFLYNLI